MGRTLTVDAPAATMATTIRHQAQIDELLLRITGLVRARERLQQRDANEAELEEASAEIGKLQWRLARAVQAEQEDRRAARPERRRSATATR